MRIVFDTNIFVSAFVFPGGSADEALQRIALGHDDLILSHAIIDECLGVIARKFGRDINELARIAVFLGGLGVTVKPRRRVTALGDEPDNRILECGIAGRADAIVTGDRAMLRLGAFQGISLLTLRQYLDSD
ncbi:MAG TPA: putative toxin-antitoxin system toxin component, PIN family [Candidatus Binataceae bacterium]|nr:putative toxin-antitoxin system toxin component, PIN family [Candidatus Binataceae bacterium]